MYIFHFLEPRCKHFVSILNFSTKFFSYYNNFFEIVKFYFHNFNYSKGYFQIIGFQD